MAKAETSKGVIKSIFAKAWSAAKKAASATAGAVKGAARKLRPKKAEVEAKAREKIAEKTGRSVSQIRKIEKGERPGANLLESLKKIRRGQRVRAPKKDRKKITRKPAPAPARRAKKARPAKGRPVEKAPEAAPAPAPPSSVEVDFRGWISIWGEDDESDPVRNRPVHVTMKGDDAAKFAALWNAGEKFEALQYTTGVKFRGIGPGILESVITEPIVTFRE